MMVCLGGGEFLVYEAEDPCGGVIAHQRTIADAIGPTAPFVVISSLVPFPC